MCYRDFKTKYRRLHSNDKALPAASDVDHLVFHAPFGKMVVKAYGRIVMEDCKDDLMIAPERIRDEIKNILELPSAETFSNKDYERLGVEVSSSLFKSKVEPSMVFVKRIGNMYCGAMFGALISLLHNVHVNRPLRNKDEQVCMFSYGSGLASSMFLLKIKQSADISKIISMVFCVTDQLIDVLGCYDAVGCSQAGCYC